MDSFSAYFFLFLIISPLLLIRHLNKSQGISNDGKETWLKLYFFYTGSAYILIATGGQSSDMVLWRQLALALLSGAGLLTWAWFVCVVIILALTALGFNFNQKD